MSNPERIGILFNETQEAALLLKGARRRHPDAHLVAILSPRAAAQFPARDLVDEIVKVELSPLRLLIKGAFSQMVKTLRAQRFDLLVLRFPTLKLRLLAAMIAPMRCEIWLAGGVIVPTPTTASAAAREYFQKRFTGVKTMVRIWCNVYCSRIPRGPDSTGGALS